MCGGPGGGAAVGRFGRFSSTATWWQYLGATREEFPSQGSKQRVGWSATRPWALVERSHNFLQRWSLTSLSPLTPILLRQALHYNQTTWKLAALILELVTKGSIGSSISYFSGPCDETPGRSNQSVGKLPFGPLMLGKT